jgi:thioredoxin 1
MRNWIQQNWPSVLLAGAIACAAAWSFTKPPGAQTAAVPASYEQTNTLPTEKEELTMSLVSKPMNKVKHANTANFQAEVLSSPVPVLVDFYADWCGPCRMIAPVLDEVAREVDGAKVVKINVDDSPDLARQFGVNSIPSLKVFSGGRVVAEHVGVASKAQLMSMLGQ